jgi:polyferredoxin
MGAAPAVEETLGQSPRSAPTGKKAYRKRTAPDRSQAVRRFVQAAFLLLNLWIGAQFYLFVRHFEVSGAPRFSRPPGVEGWLPIAGLMNLKYFLSTGEVPLVHPAAMVLVAAFLGMSFLLRKSFCGWLCPVGTLSEYLWKAGRETFRRNFALPRWLDIPLRSLKYILFGLFAYVIVTMPPRAIEQFLHSPYGVVADVKMLDFFRYMGTTAAVVIGVLLLASLFIQNFWCRYLCPYGAMTGLAALLSPLRIRRVEEKCIDCAKCAKACPSLLPVDRLVQIRSAECIACMECVAVCPAEGALDMTALLPRRYPVSPWLVAAGIAAIFFTFTGLAMLTGHWDTPVPDAVYRELIPRAREFSHP